MSRESILKIRETEEAANRMIADARQKAEQMVSEAETNGKSLCKKTEEETAAAMRTMLDEIRERTQALTERLDGESEEEVQQLQKTVSLRKKIAEKMIIRGFDLKWR